MTKICRNLIALFCYLTISLAALSQNTLGDAVSIDSAIALTSRMLTPAMMDQAKVRIDSLMTLIDGQKSKNDLLIQLKIRSLLGRYLLQKKIYEPWPELYEWCISQEASCKSEGELDLMVRMINNAGIAFKRLGRLTDSEEAYLRAYEVLKRLKNPDFALSGSVYANAGNSLKQKGEFTRAIEYLGLAISFFEQFEEKSTLPNAQSRIADQKSKAMDNLGLVYQSLGEHRKAIDMFHQCIELKLKYFPNDLAGVYGNLVISLIEVENFSEAGQIVNSLLAEYKPGMPFDRLWALAMLNRADIKFRQYHDTLIVLKEMEHIRNMVSKDIPSAHDIALVANQYSASLLIQKGQFQEALLKWAEAMKSLSTANQEIAIDEIPYNIKTVSFNKLIELMNLNAQVYYNWGKKTGDSDILKKAEERYAYTLSLIDSLRNSLEVSSKLQVSRMQRAAYNQLIEMEFLIYELTGENSYINKIFTTMEQSKSAALWSDVKDIEFKSNMIPQAELDKENSILRKIADIQGKIIEATSSQTDESRLIRELQQESVFANQQLDSLKQSYRQQYPDYYQAKFDRSTISVEKVAASLSSDQVLIEYAIAFDYIYIVAVSPTESLVTRVPFSGKTSDDIAFILNFMKGNVESLTSSARNQYCAIATDLYGLLIKPAGSMCSARELIIIPDGLLSYIPFEALLEPELNKPKQDYRKLPYIIRNHSISYGLTATVFFYQSSRVPNPSRRVLAIAPGYKMTSDNISDFIRKSEAGLPELKGTFQESRAIKKMLGGKLLTGNRATESKFKSIGQKYGILHLAMHTISDKTNSLNSGLIFTPGIDNKEDGVLFGHEVYNLSLNAWLTVLSACETGSGQMASGEGVLSFGRAFIVAGCPNLIMTMWTVDDRSSKEIMVDFYQSLLSGSGIADALQKSKIAYLDHADQLHAHPHYWAGFIELGQNQVLNMPQKKFGLIYLAILFTMTILILVYLQSKKNPRRSRDMMETNSRKL